jgi:hypothetical protein
MICRSLANGGRWVQFISFLCVFCFYLNIFHSAKTVRFSVLRNGIASQIVFLHTVCTSRYQRLYYTPKGHGIDSQCGHWMFKLT